MTSTNFHITIYLSYCFWKQSGSFQSSTYQRKDISPKRNDFRKLDTDYFMESFFISKLDLGVITPILKCLRNNKENVYILCADAKKVTAGVDGNDGDVDMFGFERGIPLFQKQALYEKRVLD